MSEGVVPVPPKLGRVEQVFPTLTPAQIARLAAHGRPRSVREGEVLARGTPDELRDRAHTDDLAEAFLHLIEQAQHPQVPRPPSA